MVGNAHPTLNNIVGWISQLSTINYQLSTVNYQLSTIKMSTSNPWIQFYQPKPKASLRLFCFPYAGGKAQIFRTWSEVLDDRVEVCPVELPGRGKRWGETPFQQLLPLVEAVAEAIAPLLDRPYTLFGHSMGALIAFELAREFRRNNSPEPVHLFISGHQAPQLPDNDPPSYNRPEEELIRKLRSLEGTPEAILENREILDLWLPIYRADLSICETYIYRSEEPLSCPITTIGGSQDSSIPKGGLGKWEEHTTGKFTKQLLLGNHFFIHSAEPQLLKLLHRAHSTIPIELPQSIL